MAKLGCPCGNVIWNGCDGDETTYYFVPLQEITAYWDVMPFFEMTCSPHGVEMWKCDVCDRMMAFDGDSESVTRYLKRVDSETLETEGEAAKGICFNNLFFNEVDRYFTCSSELGECQSYRFFDEAPNLEPTFTPHVVFEEVLSGKNGRFRNWWFAEMREGSIVLYGSSDPALRRPVKAWAKYFIFEFLKQLEGLLVGLPKDQVEESGQFYAEAIADRMEDGMTEKEAVAAMGSPSAVADSIMDGLPAVPRAIARTRRRSSVLLWVLVIAGSPVWVPLLIALALAALSVYVCIWALALCVWVVTAALVAAGLVALALAAGGIVIGHLPYVLAMLGFGLALAGITLLAGAGAWATSKQIARISALWVRKALLPFWKGRRGAGGGSSDSPSGYRATCVDGDDAARVVCLAVPADEGERTMTKSKKTYFAVAGGLAATGVVLAALGWALSGFSPHVFNTTIDLRDGDIVLGGVEVEGPGRPFHGGVGCALRGGACAFSPGGRDFGTAAERARRF